MHMSRCLRFLLVLMACSFAATGCQTSARRLEVVPVRKIIPGQTTVAEVEKMFGQPHERITGSNGKTVACYYFGEPRLNTLTLSYGSSLVIERKLHDESVTPVLRVNSRFNAGPSLLPANLNFLHRGQTKKSELIERLGEPTSTSFTGTGKPLLVWFSASYHADFVVDKETRRLIVELDTNSNVQDFVVADNDLDFLWRARR
jgi:outer membrane protein assembly factor BamE (lipoprotein component of BamABCDE complex)